MDIEYWLESKFHIWHAKWLMHTFLRQDGNVLAPKSYHFAWGSAYLGPPESKSQTASQTVQLLLHSSWHSVAILYNGPPSPLKLPLPTGGTGAHLTHDSLSPSKPKTQTVSWSGQPFLYRWPIAYNGTPLSPSNCPFPWGIWTPSNTGFLGPPESSTQTESQSVQLLLQGSLLWQTDRRTDHTTRSVTIDRIYIHTTAMWPNNTSAQQQLRWATVRPQ